MTIQQILDTKGSTIHTVAESTDVSTATRTLRHNRIGALVVTDRAGAPLGLFTESDLTRAVADVGVAGLYQPVGAVMTAAVAAVAADTSITAVMDIMTRQRTRYVLVADSAGIHGLLSIGDVVKARLDDCQLETAVLRDHYLIHH